MPGLNIVFIMTVVALTVTKVEGGTMGADAVVVKISVVGVL